MYPPLQLTPNRNLLVQIEPSPEEKLMTPREVAAILRVDPKTVTRWADTATLTAIRTPGGQRRYRESELRALLSGGTAT
jgi:excisionase family DNA binding protein